MLQLNPQNIEEYILLYHDQELNVTEQKAVENYIAQHQEAQKLFEEYALCKFKPEDEAFQEMDWSNLIQPEVTTQRKSIWLHFSNIRKVAAAVVICGCLSTIYFVNHNIADNDLDNITINIPIPEVKPTIEKEKIAAIAPTKKTIAAQKPYSTNNAKSTVSNTNSVNTNNKNQPTQELIEQSEKQDLTPIASSSIIPTSAVATTIKVLPISVNEENSLTTIEDEEPLIFSPINNKGVQKIVTLVSSIKRGKENITEQIKNIISTEKIIEL